MHVRVEKGNAAERPIDPYAVEFFFVSSVNADCPTDAGIALASFRDDTGRNIFPIAVDVMAGRIVKKHEPRPTTMMVFGDNHVQTRRCAPISFV